jgi:hypothetical protein
MSSRVNGEACAVATAGWNVSPLVLPFWREGAASLLGLRAR